MPRNSDDACECGSAQTVAILMEVLPAMIVEAAQETHAAWLDGRKPDVTEATVLARLDRIVREKFATPRRLA